VTLHVGTSGYAYKEWKGSFYPEDLPQKQFLRYYAERFSTVEANNTFYRMPSADALAAWNDQVPEGFVFAVKAPQRITHQKRLIDCGEALTGLFSATAALGPRLGPVLFQLPPNLKVDHARLRDFLALLPPAAQAAFEFRNESWFSDETWALLRARNAALVISESEKIEAPLVPTADWGYLRLRREDYVEKDIDDWAGRIRSQPWKHTYVYFKHEDAGTGPKLARSLLARFRS
jgi:uncharacterized protein YecE (DUF72 family)